MRKNTLTIIILSVLLYVSSAGVSYLVFSKAVKRAAPPPVVSKTGSVKFDDALPKTEACPLNGAMYSKQQKDWWEDHRPLGVMIENHKESRPQSGLSFADVIYEAVAEGGITRFLAVYHCQDANPIGPVRSARSYFVDFISEYAEYPLYAHVGGANTDGPADALAQIEDYGWYLYNDLNQIHDGDVGFPTFIRDQKRLPNVDTEHTVYSSTSNLWKVAKDKKDITNIDADGKAWDESFVSYTFKDDASESDRGSTKTIHLQFWDSDENYFVDWAYDKKTNTYSRKNGGQAHVDKNTGRGLSTKNLVVLFMQETQLNDSDHHLLYKTKGTGKAQVFVDGEKITATWQKDSRTDRTLLFDSSGKPIELNRGTIWFSVLPTDGVAEVK